jgi:ATP synthase protein I
MSPIFDKTLLKQFARVSTVGFHMVISTAVGLAMGYGLDRLLHTSPWFTIIFFILGVAAGFRELIRIAKRTSNGPDQENL